MYERNDELIICYKRTKTYALKVLTNTEYDRAVRLQQRLEGQTNRFLSPFEIQSHASKNFMIMPYYNSTLEATSLLSIEDGQRVVE